MEIVAKASEMLAKCGEITLASINEYGYPRVCVLSKTKSEGIRKLWVSTGTESKKVRYFKDDPNYCILGFETEEATLWIDNEFVTLRGEQL